MKRTLCFLLTLACMAAATGCQTDNPTAIVDDPDLPVVMAQTVPPTASPTASAETETASVAPEEPQADPAASAAEKPIILDFELSAEHLQKLAKEVGSPMAAVAANADPVFLSKEWPASGLIETDWSDPAAEGFGSFWAHLFWEMARLHVDGSEKWLSEEVFDVPMNRLQEPDGSLVVTWPEHLVIWYLNEAFGTAEGVRAVRRTNKAISYFSCSSGSEPVDVITEEENGPVQIEKGLLVLPFTVNGGGASKHVVLTLYVQQDGESRYGCHITAFDMNLQGTTEDYVAATQEAARASAAAAAANAENTAPQGFDAEGFVFGDSSRRYLTDEELSGLSREMLGFARNEIFARHGNIFQSDKYKDHYSQYDWYLEIEDKKSDISSDVLNEYEAANVEKIRQYEN